MLAALYSKQCRNPDKIKVLAFGKHILANIEPPNAPKMSHAFMEEYAYSICETPYGADEAALILFELYCGLKD